MPRIKIKCRDQPSKDKKLKLLEVLCSKEVHVTKVFDAKDGYALILHNEEHVDKIFTTEIKEALARESFTPLLPPEQKVKRTIIVTRVDDVIYKEHDAVDIGENMENNNAWMEGGIEQVFKFPNSQTLKITFTQAQLARKCIEDGFLAYNLKMSPYDIRQETFIPVQCCMRCFQLEDHNTRECRKSKEFKLCSECAEEGHLWHQCKEEVKKCVNCDGEHSTLAMRCPIKKQIIKNKREEEREKNKMPYTGAVKTSIQSVPVTQLGVHSVPLITKEEMLQIQICIAHARMKELDRPGSYEAELNKTLKLNNFPTIKIPKDQDGQLTTASSAPVPAPTASSSSASVTVPSTSVVPAPRSTHPPAQREETPKDVMCMNQQPPLRTAQDFGLNFYTTNDKGWPKPPFTKNDLMKGIQKGTFKWTSTNTDYSEDQMMYLMSENYIIFKECWNTVGNDVFRKIRSGVIKERSPIQSRDPRHRKMST